jgi:tetratricopeptide (TPR) repeat protein
MAKCKSWKEALSAELKVLEDEHQGNPESDKLHRDLLDVEEKIEALIERLGMELDLPDSISKTWDQIREYVGTPFEKDVVEYEELRAEKYTVYESSAMAFVSNIAGRRQEYQELLAQVGSMTEREKQGVEIYERALSLHWERKWDESIKAFREVLEFLPDDKPSLEFIGRLENYKEKPPGADWQGEFKQTKK